MTGGGRTSLGRAGLITTAMSIANILVGFAVQAVVAATLGTGLLADSFQLASVIVTFFAIALFSLVPNLLIATVENESGVCLGDAALLVIVGSTFSAVQVVVGIASTSEATSEILYFAAPCAVLAAISSYVQALCYLRRRYMTANLGPVVNGIALLTVVGIGGPTLSATTLGLALTMGYLAQCLCYVIWMTRQSFVLVWEYGSSIRRLVGVTLFTLVAKLQPVIERSLAIMIGSGVAASLGYSQKLTQGVLVLAAFGVAVNATAEVAKRIRINQVDKAARLWASGFTATCIGVSLLLTAAIPVSYWGVRLVFERGEFNAQDTILVTDQFLLQLPWVAACAIAGVLNSWLYIEQRHVQVLSASVVGLIVTVGATWLTADWLPTVAVAIGSSAGALASMLVCGMLVMNSEHWPLMRRHLRAKSHAIAGFLALPAATGLAYVIASHYLDERSVVGTALLLCVAGACLLLGAASPAMRNSIKVFTDAP